MMYDPALQWSVLRLLEKWQRLPVSDLVRMLEPLQRPKFREDLLADMEWDGLVTLWAAGDELIVEITPQGLGRLTGSRPARPASEWEGR